MHVSQEKHVIKLAISAPISPHYKYLLNVVIGHTGNIATNLQEPFLKWESIPPMAKAYLNRYVLKSGKPLEVMQVLQQQLMGYFPKGYRELQLKIAQFKKDIQTKDLKVIQFQQQIVQLQKELLAKDQEVKDVDALMNQELNKAAQKHKNEIQQLQQKLTASEKLVQDLLLKSKADQPQQEEEESKEDDEEVKYSSGKLLHTFSGHTSWVSSLAVLGQGRFLSGSADNTIKLWDPTYL